jgi:hypothetical protein
MSQIAPFLKGRARGDDGGAGRMGASRRELPTAQEVLGGGWRYVFLNVWRSMDGVHPVSEYPLAFLLPRSFAPEGMEDCAVKIKENALFPQNYVMRAPGANEEAQPSRHEWVIYPEMTADEVLTIA